MKKILTIIILSAVLLYSVWLYRDANALVIMGGYYGGGVTPGNMTIDIAADGDDGLIYNSGTASGILDVDGSSGLLQVGEYGSGYRSYGYFRFALSAAIPDGATITSATITFTSGDLSGWDLSADTMTLLGDQSADAAQVDHENDAPVYSGTATVTTTATVAYVPTAWTATERYAATITTIIQELVTDYSGLASGAHVQIWVVREPPETVQEVLHIYDESHETALVAQLYIIWE